MSAATDIINPQKYRKLVAKTLPQVIHSETENERYTAELEALHAKEHLDPEEERLAELLTLLIEDFESKHYQITPPASPVNVIRELMDANGLKQVDLADVFGTTSIVSEVLNGKRALSKTHIKKLSQRFHVSPEIFLQD